MWHLAARLECRARERSRSRGTTASLDVVLARRPAARPAAATGRVASGWAAGRALPGAACADAQARRGAACWRRHHTSRSRRRHSIADLGIRSLGASLCPHVGPSAFADASRGRDARAPPRRMLTAPSGDDLRQAVLALHRAARGGGSGTSGCVRRTSAGSAIRTAATRRIHLLRPSAALRRDRARARGSRCRPSVRPPWRIPHSRADVRAAHGGRWRRLVSEMRRQLRSRAWQLLGLRRCCPRTQICR